MDWRPTSVAAVICQALSPLSSQSGLTTVAMMGDFGESVAGCQAGEFAQASGSG